MNKSIWAAATLLTATAAAAQVAPPVAPRDAVQTRTEAVERARAMFTRADTNRDGYVTAAEVQAAHGAMTGKMRMGGQPPAADPARHAAMFDRLDANRDNMISRDEWARAEALRGERRADRGEQGQRGRRMAMRGGRMLRMADANRDNRVSLQEAASAALQRFDQVDANHDGRITQDERQQMRQVMRQRFQQQGGQAPTRH